MIRLSWMLPTLSYTGVWPIDPVLLHGDRPQTEVRGHAGHRPGVVRLHSADRHERVAALGERVGHQVLELAHLVAAEGDARVAVLALRPDLDLTAQVLAQAAERMDRRGAEGQRVPCEVVDAHGRAFGGGGRAWRRRS